MPNLREEEEQVVPGPCHASSGGQVPASCPLGELLGRTSLGERLLHH